MQLKNMTATKIMTDFILRVTYPFCIAAEEGSYVRVIAPYGQETQSII